MLSRKKNYFFLLINLIFFCLVGNGKAHAEKNILVVHSYHSGFSWTNSIHKEINNSFSKDNDEVNIFHEFLDAKRYPDLDHGKEFIDHLQSKYKETNIDILMVSDDPGLEMILGHRNNYFANIPLVFLGINHVDPKILNLTNATGVFEHRDLKETADEAMRQTGSDKIIIINDTTETGKANLKVIEKYQQTSGCWQCVEIINDLIPSKINSSLSKYSPKTPILLVGQLRKNILTGELCDLEEGVRILRTQVKNPIYALNTSMLNNGVVGGKFLTAKYHVRQTAKILKKILSGTEIESIKPIIEADNQWIFDASQLKEFNIDIESLPEGSKIINLTPSFYQEYKHFIWLNLAVLSVSILIITLLILMIRKDQIAKRELQKNETRYKDLAESGANIFWEIDDQSRFNYISGDTDSVYNYSHEQILGSSLQDLFKNEANFDFPWEFYESHIKEKKPLTNIVFRIKQKNEEVKIFQLNGKPIYDNQLNFIGYRGIKREVTQEYNLSQAIAYQASYDSLTGIINRREFNSRLKALVKDTSKNQINSVLCFLDLDRFKLVNDTAGHLVGDVLLVEITNILQGCLRKQDILGRLGGDEFGLLLVDIVPQKAQEICYEIIKKIENYRFQWDNRVFDLGISIGIISIANNSFDATELLSKADLACYKAKELGRGRLYDADEDKDLNNVQMQMEYISNVSQAIEQQQFCLVKQKIQAIDPDNSNYQHYEILLRYKDEQGNNISPALFIPFAEKYGVITIIDRWVLETTIRNYQEYFPDQQTIVSINLSGISISNKNFIDFVINLFKSVDIDLSYICLEITETAAISQMSQALEFISRVRQLGVKFALDDFGSGVSSFQYLKELPIDYLKIDGSLVKNIVTEKSDRAIIDSINCISQMMGIKTIAEFVENEEILSILAEIGVDYAQGYGIGKPELCEKHSLSIVASDCLVISSDVEALTQLQK